METEDPRRRLRNLADEAITALEDGLASSQTRTSVAKDILDRAGISKLIEEADPEIIIPPYYLTHALPGLLRLTGASPSKASAAASILERAQEAYLAAKAGDEPLAPPADLTVPETRYTESDLEEKELPNPNNLTDNLTSNNPTSNPTPAARNPEENLDYLEDPNDYFTPDEEPTPEIPELIINVPSDGPRNRKSFFTSHKGKDS